MKTTTRPILFASAITAVFFVLMMAQSGSASFRRFYTFDGRFGYIGSICSDGLSVGFTNNPDEPPAGRGLQVLISPTASLVLSQVVNTSWLARHPNGTDTTSYAQSPYCDHEFNSSPNLAHCTGLHYVKFPQELAAGTQITISFYEYDRGGTRRQMGGEGYDVAEEISNCRLGTPWIGLRNTKYLDSAAVTTDSLAFEVAAADFDIPLSYNTGKDANGLGITTVRLSVVDQTQGEVVARTDPEPPYCLFGETDNNECKSWDFAANNFTWPSGQPLVPGTYRLRADVHGFYTYDKAVDYAVEIRRTAWQQYRYLPYIDANPSWPETVVQ